MGEEKTGALDLILNFLPKCCHIQVDVNARNHKGNTAFHIAVAMGSPEKVRMFIDNGADINAVDGNGLTPLKIARIRGNNDIAIQLGEASAR